MTEFFSTAAHRQWLYRIVIALVPLLVTLGLLTGDVAQDVLNIAAAVIAISAPALASKNITPDAEVES